MPKREVPVIAHAVLTNHRIVAEAEEPYPDAAFHMTTPQLPDLVHLTEIPDQHNDSISPTVLLQAYGQSMEAHPEYRPRYFALAKKLEETDANNIDVLEALAALATEQNNNEVATRYLDSAVKHHSTSPNTYEQLGSLMIRAGRYQEAVPLLERGIQQIPYDAILYRLLGSVYLSLHKNPEATTLLRRAVQDFPQDTTLRKLLEAAEAPVTTTNAP